MGGVNSAQMESGGDPNATAVGHESRERWAKEGLAIIVVGASGDLAMKKLYSSLAGLHAAAVLPKDVVIYGFGRTEMSYIDLRARLRPHLSEKHEAPAVEGFLRRCFYQNASGYADAKAWRQLNVKVRNNELNSPSKSGNRLFCFAVPSDVIAETGEAINMNCLAPDGFNRMTVEGPFGSDLDSCKRILSHAGRHFDESDLFRMDHYLGKEMSRNLLVMRFGNQLMENVWNRKFVQCIILTYKEPVGEEGGDEQFEKYGIIREIIQNHLLQDMSLLCMECPNKLEGPKAGEMIRDEKLRVLDAMPEVTLDEVFLGQYADYSDDPAVSNKESNTPTFAMVRCFINNSRWAGVPIIFKAGKALDERKAEMRIQFKDAPAAASLFGTNVPRNEMVFKLQPHETIYMKSNIKTPGFSSAPIQSELEAMCDNRFFNGESASDPDAYSRLILDVLGGRSANFVRSDEMMSGWKLFGPVLDQIEKENVELNIYRRGTRGPANADAWFKEKSGYVRNESYAYVDGVVSKKASQTS